jgi:hypothetical protein
MNVLVYHADRKEEGLCSWPVGYTVVARVHCGILAEAVLATQNGDQKWFERTSLGDVRCERLQSSPMRSTLVGDVFLIEEQNHGKEEVSIHQLKAGMRFDVHQVRLPSGYIMEKFVSKHLCSKSNPSGHPGAGPRGEFEERRLLSILLSRLKTLDDPRVNEILCSLGIKVS